MKKICLASAIFLMAQLSAQTWKTEDQYIQKFAQFAVEEMEKYKIPASIKLAQGLIETGGGQSRLAQQANNHFGIKCKTEWTGRTISHNDDAPNECFRVYDNARQSYEDHSKFLAERPYYKGLFLLDMKDYKAWAYGLKKAGYATNPRYPQMLIDKIEKYRLYEFDNYTAKEVFAALVQRYPELQNDQAFIAQNEPPKPKQEAVTLMVPYQQTSYAKHQQTVKEMHDDKALLNSILVKSHPNGGKKFIIIPAKTDVGFIAQKFGIREAQLMKWNEITSTELAENEILFLEGKSAKGNVPTYQAQNGDTMHSISQKFGVKVSNLYSLNRMKPGDQPKIGQIIYLQNRKPRS